MYAIRDAEGKFVAQAHSKEAAHRRMRRRNMAETSVYKSSARKLYEQFKKHYRNVGYDPETDRGWADAGSLGRIEFRESANDPAVIITMASRSFKTTSDDAWETIQKLSKIYSAL